MAQALKRIVAGEHTLGPELDKAALAVDEAGMGMASKYAIVAAFAGFDFGPCRPCASVVARSPPVRDIDGIGSGPALLDGNHFPALALCVVSECHDSNSGRLETR